MYAVHQPGHTYPPVSPRTLILRFFKFDRGLHRREESAFHWPANLSLGQRVRRVDASGHHASNHTALGLTFCCPKKNSQKESGRRYRGSFAFAAVKSRDKDSHEVMKTKSTSSISCIWLLMAAPPEPFLDLSAISPTVALQIRPCQCFMT